MGKTKIFIFIKKQENQPDQSEWLKQEGESDKRDTQVAVAFFIFVENQVDTGKHQHDIHGIMLSKNRRTEHCYRA